MALFANSKGEKYGWLKMGSADSKTIISIELSSRMLECCFGWKQARWFGL